MSDRILLMICTAIIPLTAMAAGACMYFFTPEGHSFGYRTPMSEKNALTWTFANRYSGRLMFFGGIVMLPISLLVALLVPGMTGVSPETAATALCIVQAAVLMAEAVATEIALHRYFDKTGNPK